MSQVIEVGTNRRGRDPDRQKTEHRRYPGYPRYHRYSPMLDSFRRYLTDAPTPEKLATILKNIDEGDIAAICEVSQEIEAKDLYIQNLAARRREAVTALDWEIVADTTRKEDDEAQEAAEYCERVLRNLSTWPNTLKHLSTAIGPGVAVSELLWARGELVETVDVLGDRLDCDLYESPAICVITDDARISGIKTYSPGFIVHLPDARAGFPFRVTLTRATIYLWLLKHFAIADWSAFSEAFGQPTPYANYDETVDKAGREVTVDMLKNMGGGSWGAFPQGVTLSLLQASATNQPFEAMMTWIEKSLSVGWLGQTLTTEPGSVGSLALGRVHENVRASITLSDIHNEAETVRGQVLRPMVRIRWPQQNRPVPHFKRQVVEDQDLDNRRLRLDELRFAREVGLPLDRIWLHEELRIPVPKETDESEA